jgi:hypothetical protein
MFIFKVFIHILTFNLLNGGNRSTQRKPFYQDTPVSSTDENDRHDITKILLKVALNTINHNRLLIGGKQGSVHFHLTFLKT